MLVSPQARMHSNLEDDKCRLTDDIEVLQFHAHLFIYIHTHTQKHTHTHTDTFFPCGGRERSVQQKQTQLHESGRVNWTACLRRGLTSMRCGPGWPGLGPKGPRPMARLFTTTYQFKTSSRQVIYFKASSCQIIFGTLLCCELIRAPGARSTSHPMLARANTHIHTPDACTYYWITPHATPHACTC